MLPDKCYDVINTPRFIHPVVPIVVRFEGNVEAEDLLQIPLQLVTVSEGYGLVVFGMRDENGRLKR